MEDLPVELVGQILSRLGSARAVVLASLTCRKWREASRKHLLTLSFNSDDCHSLRGLSSSELEALITQSMAQNRGLQRLSILMQGGYEFLDSTVTAWLMHTRDSQLELSYNVWTNPELNVLEMCKMQNLEKLVLARNSITLLEYDSQIYPCLKSLSLEDVIIEDSDLSRLVAACPKIETLELLYPMIKPWDGQVTVELRSPSLKSVCLERIPGGRIILEADSIESLCLKGCELERFEFMGNGKKLKYFEVDESSITHLEMGDAFESLEVVDFSKFEDCKIKWSKLYQMISRSATLTRLRLWEVDFGNDNEKVDLDKIANSFPQLSHLSLSDGLLHYGLQGSCCLENVHVLRLRWTIISDSFVQWVEWLVKHCPHLQKLIIHGAVSDVKTAKKCQILASFSSSIVELMREYIHVKVRFLYE